MRHAFFLSAALVVAIGAPSIAASANPISTIQFPDGKVLDVLGTVGTGPNTAYLDIDFSSNTPAGPAYAWQFNWSGTANETSMLNAIDAADSNFSIVWDSNYAGFIDNFNYGGNVGAASPFLSDGFSYWASYIGSYNAKDSTNSTTQNVNWVYAPLGADGLTLGDVYDNSGNLLKAGVQGLLYGWTINGEFQTTNLTPTLPEVSAAPEPGSLAIVVLGGIGLLMRRRKA